MHTDEAYILQALRSGVAGYLPKAAARSELELAIKAVARGETYLSPATSKHLVREYLSRATTLEGPLSRLTVRHREILQLIAEGCTSKEIASRLGITVKTVDRQRTELMKRLDLHDIAGLVRFAIREGLILPGA
jgi:DNA-binding NarL/FixJ family response regulator